MALEGKQPSGAKGGDEGGWEEEGVSEGMQEVQLGFSAPGDRG